jgi:hypothetical protein
VQAPQDSKWDKISARIEAAGDARFKALKTNGQRASCYKEWVRLSGYPISECIRACSVETI